MRKHSSENDLYARFYQNSPLKFLPPIQFNELKVSKEKPSSYSGYKKALKVGGYIALGSAIGMGVASGGLYLAGFKTIGIVKGSAAAGWMAGYGGMVTKGSLLAFAQSVTTSTAGLASIFGLSAVGGGVTGAVCATGSEGNDKMKDKKKVSTEVALSS